MQEKITVALAAACVVATLSATPAHSHDASRATPSERETYNLNHGWLTSTTDIVGAQHERFDDSAWSVLSLPHAFNEHEAFARDIKKLSTGTVWYRKRFSTPARWTGKAFLEFEGVRQAGEVWVNGQSVAVSE